MNSKIWSVPAPLKIALAAGLLGASLLAHGADPRYSASYGACVDHSDGVTLNMHNCIAQELTLQNARLNYAYQKLRSQISTARQKELKGVERLWIKYRDANCDFYADPDGGTIAGLAADECVLRETSDRATELESLIE